MKATRARTMIVTVFAALALAAVTACKSSPKDTGGQPEMGWNANMQQLSASLTVLLPMTLDPMQFNDPVNQTVIETEINRLTHFSHSVDEAKNKPSQDPGMNFVAKQFNTDMVEAKRQLKMGNRSYSRFLIRNATNYCISCHTQSDKGPQFNFEASGPFFTRLNPLDRAHFLFAVRNFDAGLQEFEKAMNSPDIALQPYANLESVTLKALAVAIRVKKDPALAQRILDGMIQSKWAPVYLQLSGMKWRASVAEWRRGKVKESTLADAKRLVSQAWKKQMESPLSRSGLIEYLRASAVLHDLLAKDKTGKAHAEAMYYAGLCSEALKELDLYNLSEHYYESCVRHLPHSDMARNCFLRLEGVTMANYTQFDSAPLPVKVRERLDELKQLAETKGKPWSDWREF